MMDFMVGGGFAYNCDIYSLNVSLRTLSANELIVIKCDFTVHSGVRTDLKVGSEPKSYPQSTCPD